MQKNNAPWWLHVVVRVRWDGVQIGCLVLHSDAALHLRIVWQLLPQAVMLPWLSHCKSLSLQHAFVGPFAPNNRLHQGFVLTAASPQFP